MSTGEVAEWFKAHAWKVCWVKAHAGSNPVFSAMNKKEERTAKYVGLGVAFGAAFGAALGDLGMGIAIGVALGAAIGTQKSLK